MICSLFKENGEGLENKKMPRSKFSNLEFHEAKNIIERKVFIPTDASDEKDKGLLRYVAYLSIEYKKGQRVWHLLIADQACGGKG